MDVEVCYCEGWDPLGCEPVGPLSTELAAERDRAGEQYAVLLTHHGDPVAMAEICWAESYLNMWVFDQAGDRVAQIETHRLGDRLAVKSLRQWEYEDDDLEFADEALFRWRRLRTCAGQGKDWIVDDEYLEDGESIGRENAKSGISANTVDAPVFGRWDALPALAAFLEPAPAPWQVARDGSDPHGRGLPPGTRPWRPPGTPQPVWLDELLADGGRGHDEYGDPVTIELKRFGVLPMPSGQLIVHNPLFDSRAQPLTVTFPAGEYPVVGANEMAVSLIVVDEPVAGWEPALQQGDEAWMLEPDQSFRFGGDMSTGCFSDGGTPIEHPATNANLITFGLPGDGGFPVWIGRTADGRVARVVADVRPSLDVFVPEAHAG